MRIVLDSLFSLIIVVVTISLIVLLYINLKYPISPLLIEYPISLLELYISYVSRKPIKSSLTIK